LLFTLQLWPGIGSYARYQRRRSKLLNYIAGLNVACARKPWHGKKINVFEHEADNLTIFEVS
jgi:hypothetical protein